MTTKKINPIAVRAAAAGAKMEAKLAAEKQAEIAAVEAQGLEARAQAEAEAERVKAFDAKRGGQPKQLWPALSEDANTWLAPVFAEPAPGLTAAELEAAHAVIGLMNNEVNRAIVLHHLNPRPVSDIYFCDNQDIAYSELRHRTAIISHAAKTPAGLSVTEHLNRILIAVEQVAAPADAERAEIVVDIYKGPRIAWSDIDRLVNQLYKLTGTKKADRTVWQQYTTDRVNALNYYYSDKEIMQLYGFLLQVSANPRHAENNQKQELITAIIAMLNPYPAGFIQIELYFNSEYYCTGGEASDLGTDDIGCDYKRDIMIRVGFNPVNLTLLDIFQHKNKV